MITIFTKYTMWLSNRVRTEHSYEYMFLLSELNKIEYYFVNAMDEDRVKWALLLRDQFAKEEGTNDIYNVMPGSCTALELLISMAEAADFTLYDNEEGRRPEQFFWIFIHNLGLSYLTDAAWSFDATNFIFSVITKWFDRRFSPNGTGTPWPNNKTRADLTNVPMWDAMQWWLADNEEVL